MALSKGPLARAEKIQKAASRLEESNCIAAIDFGTSSLSVAYTTQRVRGDVKVLPLHSTMERVPNSILIMKDQMGQQYLTIGIGHQAQSMHSDIKKAAKNFIYFERIKNLLQRDKVS